MTQRFPDSDSDYLEILHHNKGFADPGCWLAYAKRKEFRRIRATPVSRCPACGSELGRAEAQYIYYSTCIRLRRCVECDLIYADQRIDQAVIQEHFEVNYKDPGYFIRARRSIFRQIVAIVADTAAPGASVLDVGGASGELLALVRSRRGDLKLVLNDISREACRLAEEAYGLETVSAPLSELDDGWGQFDVLLLIDVMYYDPDLPGLWAAVSRLVGDSGELIARLPNSRSAIALAQKLLRPNSNGMQVRVRFFNPEHLYIFSKRYLRNELARCGFEPPEFIPARLLSKGGIRSLAAELWWCIAMAVWFASGKRLILTPSMLMRSRPRREKR